MKKYIIAVVAGVAIAFYLVKSPELISHELDKRVLMKQSIEVTSNAFKEGGSIPSEYSCDGTDAFIPLQIDQVPSSAKTIAVICDDPDAPSGVWVHLVLFNIPASIAKINSLDDVLNAGGVIGTNSWHKQTWGGPCPPSGTHRYYFKVYALDVQLSLDKNANKTDLLAAMEGHVVGYGELMGKYQKTK